MPQDSLQGIFAYREILSFQYCQNDKEGASYKGQILWASIADLTPEEQAEIGEASPMANVAATVRGWRS